MALNVTAIIDQIKTRIAAADSSTNSADLIRLIQAAQNFDNYSTSSISFAGDLPTEDSSIAGDIIFVRDKRFDDKGTFYFGRDSATWDRVLTSSELLEDSNYGLSTVVIGPAPPSFTGENYGYTSGGITSNPSATIDKVSFASDGNATTVGSLSQARNGPAGQSSDTHGYNAGGWAPPAYTAVDKFSFASDGNATFAFSIAAVAYAMGHSSTTDGYYSGSNQVPSQFYIMKYPFAVETSSTNIGNLSTIIGYGAGHSDHGQGYGYVSGGYNSSFTSQNKIDSFPFASNSNSTTVGTLTRAVYNVAGQGSATHGYTSGGQDPTGTSNKVEKWPFATSTTSALAGVLTVARYDGAEQSSTVSGYTSGGNSSNVIDKFSFAADTNATDVGDLTVARSNSAGQQY